MTPPLQVIRKKVEDMAKAISQQGGRTFLVGGAVRDRMRGLEAKQQGTVETDADLEVFGMCEADLETLLGEFGKVHLVGKRFAVLHVATDAGPVEVALPRRESKTGPGHKGFAVEADPYMKPEDAARRRDFTANAMMEDVLTGEILDPWNGQSDIEKGLLRHVSPAFAEDPLRVLRAARFVARFGWRIHPDTAALCRSLDLSELPRERLEGEWKQILLHGKFPGTGLLALELVGGLEFFPELAALRGVPQDPIWHPEGDVLHHTAMCLNEAVNIRGQMEDPWVEMLAILCHDLGKATETQFERSRWRSAAHDTGGVEPTRTLLARITAQEDVVEQVVALVREHLRPSQLWHARDQVSDAAIRRLAMRVNIPALTRVAWGDAAGRTCPQSKNWAPAEWLLERAAGLGVKDNAPQPFLRGKDLLDRGMAPGKDIGRILEDAFELQLEGELADREAAVEWLNQKFPSN